MHAPPGGAHTADRLLDDLPCGYLLLSLDGAIQYANRWFETCVGISHQQAARRRFQEFLAPGGSIFYETQFSPTLLLRGQLREISFDLRSPDGARVPVLVNAALIEDIEGRRDCIALIVYEIAQRRLFENELLRAQRESEQMAEVVRRSSDAVIRLSTQGRIESWNEGARAIFGFTAPEAIGADIFGLLFASENIGEACITLLKRGKRVEREAKATAKSGAVNDISLTLTPHMEAPGILVAFSAILRDITAPKRAERALMQNEKLASVGRLASSIAHEINNPLEAVTNLLYILRTRVADPDTLALIVSAEDELARVSHIARHTLRFHRQSSSRTDVNLHSLIESALGLYRARFASSGITASIHCDPSHELHCFEGELRQILVNLISNAFDAMRNGGRLRIRVRSGRLLPGDAAGTRITIADSGCGIPPEAIGHLFEAFYSTKGIGGTGLGLWITRDLMNKNAGTIRVRSSASPEHHGTAIMLQFPCSPAIKRPPDGQ